jgi:hypothetical protein
MEVEEQPTLSVNEQIEEAAASRAAAAAADETAYNFRPRPKLPDADDAAFLLANRSNTIVHALELLPAPQIQPYSQTKSAFSCIREIIVDNNRPAEPVQSEEEIIDVEVEVIAETIVSDWRQLHKSLMHTFFSAPSARWSSPTNNTIKLIIYPSINPTICCTLFTCISLSVLPQLGTRQIQLSATLYRSGNSPSV